MEIDETVTALLDSEYTDKDLCHSMGRRIREIRKELNLGLNDIAQRVGVSAQQIQKYESGESIMSGANLMLMAIALKTDPFYFMQGFKGFTTRANEVLNDYTRMMQPQINPIHILWIENDDASGLTVRRALGDCTIPSEVLVLHDRQTVCDFVKEKSTRIDFPAPDIIFLADPIQDSTVLEMLKMLKQEKMVSNCPMIVVSTTIDSKAMNRCYQNGATGYMMREPKIEFFTEQLQNTLQYWGRTLSLPHRIAPDPIHESAM